MTDCVDANQTQKDTFKILFVGNSFTYGPPPDDRLNKQSLNNLPRFFKLAAESLGFGIDQDEDTIGGCTLYLHRPSVNADGEKAGDPTTCQEVVTDRVPSAEKCTITYGILYWPDNSPCPQKFLRQAYGVWNAIVLQDHSQLPTVLEARRQYYLPAFEEYRDVADRTGMMDREAAHHDLHTLIVSHMTWGYYQGAPGRCPGGSNGNPVCFPHGSLNELSNCENSSHWYEQGHSAACQTYSLARGAAEALSHGADVVVPCGLAWLAARGAPPIPDACRAATDADYVGLPNPLESLDLPLQVPNQYARWQGSNAHALYRFAGEDYKSKYCDDGCHHDHHASEVGQYLNALVFVATLLKVSPIGADYPRGQVIDGMVMPSVSPTDAAALQHVAQEVVMPHMNVWWQGLATWSGRRPQTPRAPEYGHFAPKPDGIAMDV